MMPLSKRCGEQPEDEVEVTDRVIAQRYKVLSEIGSGGDAVVYKTVDQTLMRVCALKMLKIRSPSPQQLVRFQQEARSVSSLRHPHIVPVLDFGLDEEEKPYLVMEYVPGRSLLQHIQERGPLEVEDAVRVVMQVCDAMAYTHSHGVLHRDLKTSNIMIADPSEPEGIHSNGSGLRKLEVMLLDFGIARQITSEAARLTHTGAALGTPAYMSPEQGAGRELDERSDIYSLGCVMYEILTGRLPFKGTTLVDTISMRMDQPAPPLSCDDIEFPEEVERAVARMLEQEPARRFSSMTELKAELEKILDDDTATSAYDESLSDDAAPYEPVFSGHAPASSMKRRLVVVSAAVLLTVAIALLLGRIQTEPGVSTDDLKTEKPDDITTLRIAGVDINTLPSVPWENGITWSKMFLATNEDIYKLKPGTNIQYISISDLKDISSGALRHLAGLKPLGIGLADMNLEGRQLAIVTRADPDLEVLYLYDNIGLVDADLECLTRLKRLRFLSLSNNRFSDRALDYVSEIKSLETLKLDELENLKGDGLKKLEALPSLERLTLASNKINHDGWQVLPRLTHLKVLNLEATGLDDSKLEGISHLNLERLDISDSKVTDRGLEKLYRMTDLQLLRMHDCSKISEAAEAKLKRHLPRCTVSRRERGITRHRDPLLIEEKKDK